LSQEQVDLLTGIGFVWKAGGQQVLQDEWQAMYQKLKAYYERHGTCNVSQKAKGDDGRIGRWVKTQREKYHRTKPNTTPLTPQQIEQLESIGFQWRPGGTASNEETWQNMFEQLRAYQKEHGDCRVPQKVKKLSGWVDRQRKRYRATLQADEFSAKPENKGKKPPSLQYNTYMPKEQIDALNSIGFIWSFRERRSNPKYGENDENNNNGEASKDDSLHHIPPYHPTMVQPMAPTMHHARHDLGGAGAGAGAGAGSRVGGSSRTLLPFPVAASGGAYYPGGGNGGGLYGGVPFDYFYPPTGYGAGGGYTVGYTPHPAAAAAAPNGAVAGYHPVSTTRNHHQPNSYYMTKNNDSSGGVSDTY